MIESLRLTPFPTGSRVKDRLSHLVGKVLKGANLVTVDPLTGDTPVTLYGFFLTLGEGPGSRPHPDLHNRSCMTYTTALVCCFWPKMTSARLRDAWRHMRQDRKSLKPVEGANRSLRQRLGLRGELSLA